MFEQDKIREVDNYTNKLLEEYRKVQVEYWKETESFDAADYTRRMTNFQLINEAIIYATNHFKKLNENLYKQEV